MSMPQWNIFFKLMVYQKTNVCLQGIQIPVQVWDPFVWISVSCLYVHWYCSNRSYWTKIYIAYQHLWSFVSLSSNIDVLYVRYGWLGSNKQVYNASASIGFLCCYVILYKQICSWIACGLCFSAALLLVPGMGSRRLSLSPHNMTDSCYFNAVKQLIPLDNLALDNVVKVVYLAPSITIFIWAMMYTITTINYHYRFTTLYFTGYGFKKKSIKTEIIFLWCNY